MDAGDDGKRSRTVVIGYVRRSLPAGSTDAFTPEELAQLGATFAPSHRFDPYAGDGALDAGAALR